MPRVFTAHTPLGPEELKFHTMRGREALSRLFDLQLTLASANNSIAMNALLGQSVTVEIEREDKSRRYLNGFVTEFSQVRRDGRLFIYEARVRPQFWYLTQTRDFRVFQKMTARDIVKQVLSEFGVAIKDQLTGYYRPRDYTVQYGESAFDFVSRLLEEEGAGYWFQHAMGSHVMVLSDSISAYPVLPGHATIPYYPADQAAIPDQEFVNYWSVYQTVNPGKYASRDYDFKKPKANLDVIQPKPRDHAHNQYEKFAFPGVYREVGDGENYARVNIEELQTDHERADGHTNVRGFTPGYRFTLSRCPRADQNREYLIVSADYNWTDNSYEGGAASKQTIHETSFCVQPSAEPYRPERITPYPDAKGPDSAIITGPAGEEIWTDSHGRVKVQFHWDRYGKKDENSSCWVRISQPWAGSNFGAIHLPRIGQEVLVEYVNGNPDHPVITSRLYNADNMPPWGLPSNATQSGILTRSSKGGGYDNANAIRFEDKKGEEQLWLHAEKDQLTEVEHDEDKWVGNDRRKTIDRDETSHIRRDRTETVDRDETITVHGQRTEVVDGNEDITIHSNRKERVDQNETISIGQNRDEDVGASETISIANNRDKKIGSNESDDIGSNWKVSVGQNLTETVGIMNMQTVGMMKMSNVGVGYSVNVGMMMNTLIGLQQSEQVGKNKSVTVGENLEVKAGKIVKFEVGEHFEIVCGAARIVLKSDGGIYLEGKHIELNGGDAFNAEAKLVQINTGAAKVAPEAKAGGEEANGKEGVESTGAAASGAGASGANGLLAGASSGLGGLAAAAGGLGGLAEAAGKVAGAVQQAQGIVNSVKSIASGNPGAIAGALGGLAGGAGAMSGSGSAKSGGMPLATPGWAG